MSSMKRLYDDVIDMYLEGKSYEDISEELGLFIDDVADAIAGYLEDK